MLTWRLLSIPDTIKMLILFSIIPSPPPPRAHKKACVHDILLTFKWIPFKSIGGFLGISDDLMNFWEDFNKNKMLTEDILNVCPKSLLARYHLNRWLDRI